LVELSAFTVTVVGAVGPDKNQLVPTCVTVAPVTVTVITVAALAGVASPAETTASTAAGTTSRKNRRGREADIAHGLPSLAVSVSSLLPAGLPLDDHTRRRICAHRTRGIRVQF
jgi:hypothetical protein